MAAMSPPKLKRPKLKRPGLVRQHPPIPDAIAVQTICRRAWA